MLSQKERSHTSTVPFSTLTWGVTSTVVLALP